MRSLHAGKIVCAKGLLHNQVVVLDHRSRMGEGRWICQPLSTQRTKARSPTCEYSNTWKNVTGDLGASPKSGKVLRVHMGTAWAMASTLQTLHFKRCGTGRAPNPTCSWTQIPRMMVEIEERFLCKSQALSTSGQKSSDCLDILISFQFCLHCLSCAPMILNRAML